MKRVRSLAISSVLAIVTLVAVFLVKPVSRSVSAEPNTAQAQAADESTAGISLAIPEAEAQTCATYTYNECGCKCLVGGRITFAPNSENVRKSAASCRSTRAFVARKRATQNESTSSIDHLS
jgi:hypothetical protein